MHGHTKLSTVEQSHTMWKPQASCLHNTESRVESSTKLPWLVEHGFQLDPQGCRELNLQGGFASRANPGKLGC